MDQDQDNPTPTDDDRQAASPPDPAEGVEEAPASAGADTGEDEPEADDDPSGGGWSRVVANHRNATIIGELRMYYVERTVSLIVDGDCALRIMASCRLGTTAYADELVPARSDATAGWVLVKTEGLLSISWIPATDHLIPRRPSMAAFDPVVA